MSNVDKIIKTIKERIAKDYGKHHLQWYSNYLYKGKYGKNVNWDHPTDFNEKIHWMMFYTDTSLWSTLADKCLVKDYLKEKGYGDILTKTYGVWENADEIDFNELPDSFVIKTNHGYGEVIVVDNKMNYDLEKIRQKMSFYLKTPFGYTSAEPHYLKIKPVILAEEMLPNDLSFSTSMVDYKFYCFNGKPMSCGVFYNRDKTKRTKYCSFYDMDWNFHPEWMKPNKNTLSGIIPKPFNFERMKQLCADLTQGIPFVRLDFYESRGKVYFGEFTFTPAGALGGSLNPSLFKQYGDLIDLSLCKKN